MKFGQAARMVRGENWLLSQYEAYTQNRDLNKEREAISELLSRPYRKRTESWSGSGANTCLRQRQLTYLGFPKARPDDKTMNIFANGDYVHIRHQAFGLAAGYIAAAEVSVTLPDYNMLGTMDGILANGCGLEIKSINSYGFSEVSTYGPKMDHRYQVQAYMLASGLEAFHFLYEDKNTNVCREFLERKDVMLQDHVKRDLEKLQKSTETHKLEPMLKECRNGEGKFRWCPFAEICEDATWPTQSVSLQLPTLAS